MSPELRALLVLAVSALLIVVSGVVVRKTKRQLVQVLCGYCIFFSGITILMCGTVLVKSLFH